MKQNTLCDYFSQTAKLKTDTPKTGCSTQRSPKRKISSDSDSGEDKKVFSNNIPKKSLKHEFIQLPPDFELYCDNTTIIDLTNTTDNENEETFLELSVTEVTNYWNVNNFKCMLKFINSKENMQKLLHQTDVNTLNLLQKLDDKYFYLILKLFTYLPKWYNAEKFIKRIKLEYAPEDICHIYKELKAKSLILTDFAEETAYDILNYLQKPQVKDIAKMYKMPAKKSRLPKKDLINAIIDHCYKQPTLSSKTPHVILKNNVIKVMGHSMKLNPSLYRTLYKVHVLYIIGTELYKISDVYLFMSRINKNEIMLPTITVQNVDLFATQDEFERYAKAHQMYSQFQLAFDKSDRKSMESIAKSTYTLLFECVKANRPPPLKKRLSEEHLYIRILCQASQHLTTTCDPLVITDWLKLLLKIDGHRKRGYCYSQLSLLNGRYIKSNNEAARYLLDGLKDKTLTTIELNVLKEKSKALLKARKDPVCNEIREAIENIKVDEPKKFTVVNKLRLVARVFDKEITGNKKTYVSADDDCTTYTSVEQLALNHYKRSGYKYGLHCEGSLITTLFGVLFWDIIYCEDVPDVFITELQYLPYDLYSISFYTNREEAITKRLKDIASDWEWEELTVFVRNVWDEHSYKRSLITLNMFQADMLSDIIACIDRGRLAVIFERLVSDFKEFTAGMPDLFVWDPVKSICKFVEVKGEGDKLSMKQKFWLDFLHVNKIDCELCLVSTAGSSKKHNGY